MPLLSEVVRWDQSGAEISHGHTGLCIRALLGFFSSWVLDSCCLKSLSRLNHCVYNVDILTCTRNILLCFYISLCVRVTFRYSDLQGYLCCWTSRGTCRDGEGPLSARMPPFPWFLYVYHQTSGCLCSIKDAIHRSCFIFNRFITVRLPAFTWTSFLRIVFADFYTEIPMEGIYLSGFIFLSSP